MKTDKDGNIILTPEELVEILKQKAAPPPIYVPCSVMPSVSSVSSWPQWPNPPYIVTCRVVQGE